MKQDETGCNSTSQVYSTVSLKFFFYQNTLKLCRYSSVLITKEIVVSCGPNGRVFFNIRENVIKTLIQ